MENCNEKREQLTLVLVELSLLSRELSKELYGQPNDCEIKIARVEILLEKMEALFDQEIIQEVKMAQYRRTENE